MGRDHDGVVGPSGLTPEPGESPKPKNISERLSTEPSSEAAFQVPQVTWGV